MYVTRDKSVSLKDLEYIDQSTTTIFRDNQGCIALAKNPEYHARTKHIDIKFHFLPEKVLHDVIALKYKRLKRW